MTEHLSKMADEVFEAMRGFVARSLESVLTRIEALESRQPENGADGLNGKDADEAVITAAVLEKVTKALEAIPAPKDGIDGAKGDDGLPGKDADADAITASVIETVTKAIEAIPIPRDGREGEPGRDALHIDVVETVDETKRYQRGTFAHYKGGIIRSFRATDPILDGIEKAGWHVVVDGVSDIDIEMVGERGVTVKTTRLSGAVTEKSFKTAAVVDREVFKEGQQYEKGDGVTWGRHYWIARKDTDTKPDVGPNWRLAVKGGRDGTDADAVIHKAPTMQEIVAVILKDISVRGPIWRALEKDPPIR